MQVKEPFLKRPFDFTLALLGLIFTLPLWLVFPLAICLEDRGPVFFLQERCGKGGRVFPAIKFRTMKLDGNASHKDIDLEEDPRVTKVGKILRATGMDELPGLINIVKGEMSFVGPRPLPFKIEDEEESRYQNIAEIPGYHLRSRVRPGLTGVAQIYAPKDAPRKNKFRYDNLYIEKMSFPLDLKLIVLSFWITSRGKWEHRGRKI